MTAVGIPRLFHWVWLGGAPLPDAHRAWIDGWSQLHPAWEGHIWTERELPRLRNQAAFDAAESFGQKADVVRYELLLDHGGVYLDTDFECLRNIEPLLSGCNAFAGEERPGLIGNAILGAVPGHPWMEAVVSALPGSFASHFLTMERTGPWFLSRCTADRTDVTVFPPEVFYPLSSSGDTTADGFGEGTYAVHRFAKSWKSGEEERVTGAARVALDARLPAGTKYVLIGSGLAVDLPGRTAVPFYGRDGVDWGEPADDESALEQLRRHRDAGMRWVVVLASAFWWLDYYEELGARLRAESLEAVEHPALVAFRLGD